MNNNGIDIHSNKNVVALMDKEIWNLVGKMKSRIQI